eukprot:TRINITY_DN12493_c0_g1_i1.p1 TRINITY_DN12493_c0_g1~~TRINITY_DN12493_c0_g1_i1.p1  ORF type:complete len:662 (-),score=96.00 TRINITY_DN12493_c0_g1_i1:84-2069(-)
MTCHLSMGALRLDVAACGNSGNSTKLCTVSRRCACMIAVGLLLRQDPPTGSCFAMRSKLSRSSGKPTAKTSATPHRQISRPEPSTSAEVKQSRQKIRVVWFKSTDLRTHDHAALEAAHQGSVPVLHIFVFEPRWYRGRTSICGFPRTGSRRANFQLECLADLRGRLEKAGHHLSVVWSPSDPGPWSTARVFRELCRQFEIESVYASQEVCDEELRLMAAVRQELVSGGAGPLQLFWTFELHHHDDLPFNPSMRMASSYSAFKRDVEEQSIVRPPRAAVDTSASEAARWLEQYEVQLPSVEELLATSAPDLEHSEAAELHWRGGETAALARLEEYFFESDALGFEYVGATMTTNPSKSVLRDGALSKLSPWLAHGCISPRYIHAQVQLYEATRHKSKSTYWILHELRWRDFVRFSTLYAGSSIFKVGGLKNIQPAWQWSRDLDKFDLWQHGQTGYPIIDSFMRELTRTGYCNHMGRETAGWFLIRDLGIDWRMGAEWFESVLLDYEPAANWFNWVYRCLPAAASVQEPGKHLNTLEVLLWAAQHDPDAKFVQRWLPELGPVATKVGANFALEPWRLRQKNGGSVGSEPGAVERRAWALAAASELEESGEFRYGVDYPLPAVPPVEIRGVDTENVAREAKEAQAKQLSHANTGRLRLSKRKQS